MYTVLPSSSLRISGADRIDFVQGQMTGDLRGAATPGLVPCAFLNVKGQIEYFARAYKRSDDIYLHLDAEQSAGLAARFKRYIIFDQVEVQDTTDTLQTVHVWDATGLAGWQLDGPEAQQFELGGVSVLGGRVNRTGTAGVDLHFLARDRDAVLADLGPQASLNDLDKARIAAGMPDITRDGFTGTLPQEVGLDVGGPLPAISYRKGCYVGQEIMARLEARGKTRYHLVRLSGADLPSHSEITLEGKVVGQGGLSVGPNALARLRKEITADQTVLVGGQPAQVELL